jgi:uncharacterized OB-fold protein
MFRTRRDCRFRRGRLIANIVESDPKKVRCGTPVRVVFEKGDQGDYVAPFKLAVDAASA